MADTMQIEITRNGRFWSLNMSIQYDNHPTPARSCVPAPSKVWAMWNALGYAQLHGCTLVSVTMEGKPVSLGSVSTAIHKRFDDSLLAAEVPAALARLAA